jgi:hypothetical protein
MAEPTAIISPATNRFRSASAATRLARTRAAGDGQGSEAVDHPGCEVLGNGHAGLGGAEPDREDEDPGQ